MTSMRSGYADLPLHGGRVPAWLATRMAALGRVIAEAIVHHYGADELLRRLSHPFWFQSFGSVMGMDWPRTRHASHSRTAARTGTRFPYPSRSTMRRCACSSKR